MKNITFVQIEKDNAKQYDEIFPLWCDFLQELARHENRVESMEEVVDSLRKRIRIQGNRADMHFDIVYYENQAIGLVNYAIDLGTIGGLIEAGYGMVMGFYIAPAFRGKGFGRRTFEHVQSVLRGHGATHMHICPDPVTGEPFWSAMGFVDSGKIDPDDKLPIFIKQIRDGGIHT